MKRLFLALVIMVVGVAAHAQRLPRTVFPVHYDLTFTPDFNRDIFRGDEFIDVSVQQPTTSITLHSKNITIDEVSIAARGRSQAATVTLDDKNDMATLTVGEAIPTGPATIRIRYRGVLNTHLQGLYLGHSSGKKYAATQMEATYARQAFPCFDEPGYKATFAITAIVDTGHVAISNGSVVSDEPAPSGKHTVRFSTTPRMSSYLVALVVGDFKSLDGEVDGIPLRIWAAPDKVELGRYALEATKTILAHFNKYYGIKYPFGKLDQIAIPDFQAGAMENTGAIIYRETALLVDEKTAPTAQKRRVAEVIAHEIGHQWFGDIVTMEWWDDIWLNEGFATWITAKPVHVWRSDWSNPADLAAANGEAITVDSLATTRPIRTNATSTAEIDELFDSIAYQKTAAMLRMVESYIGEEDFRKGINDYLAAHAYDNATAEDFTRAVSLASGKPVSTVVESFIRNAGVPMVTAASRCEAGNTVLTLSQQRFFNDRQRMIRPSPEVWSIPVCYRRLGAGGQQECQILSAREQRFEVAGCGPVVVNSGAMGYYIAHYAADDASRLVAAVESMTPAERVVLVRDEFRLVRIGARSVGDFLTLTEALRRERHHVVLSEVLGNLELIAETMTTPATEESYRAWVRGFVGPIVAELGWSAKPNEPETTRELRAKALFTLGYTGRDPKTIAEAKRFAKRFLDEPASVDPTLPPGVMPVAAAFGDAKLYDRVRRAVATAATPERRSRLLDTLAHFRDPVLARRTLEWSLSPEVRTQDVGTLLGGVLDKREVHKGAWEFLKANWAKVQEKLPPMAFGAGLGRVVNATSTFCDLAAQADVRAFFASHPVPGTERRQSQALEKIAQCADLRATQGPKLAEWLNQKQRTASR